MKPKVVIPPLKKPIVPLLQIGKIGKMVGNIPLGSPKDLPPIDKMLNARKTKNMYTSESQSPLFDFYIKPPVCNTGEADYLHRFFLDYPVAESVDSDDEKELLLEEKNSTDTQRGEKEESVTESEEEMETNRSRKINLKKKIPPKLSKKKLPTQSNPLVAIVNRPIKIPVNVKAKLTDILVLIKHNNFSTKKFEIQEKKSGEYLITFTPWEEGEYEIEILISGKSKHIARFIVKPVSFTYNGPREVTTFVGKPVKVDIAYPNRIKEDQVSAMFKPQNGNLQDQEKTIIKILENNIISLNFTPQQPGIFQTPITIQGKGVIIENITVIARAIPSIKITGGNRTKSKVNTPFKCKLQVINSKPQDLTFTLKTPTNTQEKISVKDIGNNVLELVYTPRKSGKYSLQITIEGMNPQHLELNVV
jgi:hypothetical protein